ncbi:MAG: GlsB/YeaQ/YmgE family stress response membrane protein [Actinobacteria bacterium]|nr:GlsB/YeaQ/YmgE family stress response membrane protein [Actinomycetota bacterium]
MHWIWLIIVGAIVGALGRLLHPGSDPMGWILTIVLGIVSLVIAGVIFSSGVLQFVVGIVIAAVLLIIWSRVAAGRSRTV